MIGSGSSVVVVEIVVEVFVFPTNLSNASKTSAVIFWAISLILLSEISVPFEAIVSFILNCGGTMLFILSANSVNEVSIFVSFSYFSKEKNILAQFF